MRVFIGADRREWRALKVAASSLVKHASIAVNVIPLDSSRLHLQGLLRRVVDARGGLYDLSSNAPQSTEFAISRFLVPFLSHTGWALFVDCDVVFLGDIAELLELADHTKAVQVVKHAHKPKASTKMDGQPQMAYERKNWSSVTLWNCDHPANRRLTLDSVNNWPGRELHAFCWLHESEIGELPHEWNWLVNETEQPPDPKIAHFTNGGPWIDGWKPQPHDQLWLNHEL